ncbi:bamB [Symbiodinium pilosum]|uniref:BamB protein n=1 Tax=Symbiodinium pilosum TaxID=2952 RepID=A0A812W2Z1_SYMPI|nr:bamB [Symbiodinium pilosum]
MEAVWRWLALCVCAGSAGNDACDLQADRCSEGSGASEATALLQLASTLEARSSFNESYWYPVRGLDAGRSGWSQRASGPFPLSAPSWSFEIPGLNFHQTPVIDDTFHVYTTSDNGKIFKFTREGLKRWEFLLDQPGTVRCQNPSLFDGKLYTACANGHVLALDMDNGNKVWSRWVFPGGLPTDTYTVSATEAFLVLPLSDAGDIFGGSWGVAVLERADGSLRWSYNVSERAPGATVINLDPCLLEDSIVLSDTTGGIYRLNLTDGSEIWRVPGLDEGSFTLGGVACSEGLVFNGFSRADESGGVRALSLEEGEVIWAKSLEKVVHNAPAVSKKLYGHESKELFVVIGMGEPTGRPLPIPANISGKVLALEGLTGNQIWSFEPPPWHHHGAAGSTWDQLCFPDLFSAATIDATGTVYINWSAGGITYALRDADANGLVSMEDPKEVSEANLSSAATGPPALAPGMLFVNTCRRPSAFF